MSHLLLHEFERLDMRGYYRARGVYPTSTDGDTELIRSHVAYWAGLKAAERVSIKPSRGHSYRVALNGTHGSDDTIVRITDYYEHRYGVVGLYHTP